MKFKTALYLDDIRTPMILGMDIVRSYDEFVQYCQDHGTPDLISFDHDLSMEHYPAGVQTVQESIDYSGYAEKTGYHCAQFLVENKIPVRYWNVHSWNVVGKRNIEALLREHYPAGEVKLDIPFVCK